MLIMEFAYFFFFGLYSIGDICFSWNSIMIITWALEFWMASLSSSLGLAGSFPFLLLLFLFSCSLWLNFRYIFKARFEPNSEHSYKVVVAYAFMGLAGTMELFDFPPILEVIDPHSLWHLGTIPCFFVLLDFYLQDSLYEEKKEAKRRHHIV